MQQSSDIRRQLASFAAIGLACTAAFAVLYSVLRSAGVPALAANALSLLATMGANFAANRRLTFAAAGGPILRQLVGYVIAYGIGLAASTVALATLLDLLNHPHGALDTGAAFAAGLAATAVRFALMRTWVFAPRTATEATA
jgi:putative flippase GtrA